MDAAKTFKRILLFLTAGLFIATAGQAATLVVDNANVPLTGSIQSQNVFVRSSDSSALNFDITSITYPNAPAGLPAWLNATATGCTSNCPTPATLTVSLTNDLGHYGSGPFTATVTLTPHAGGASTQITVTFYPGPGGIPGAISVTPSPFDPVSTVPIAYTTAQTAVPTQQILVTGTSSYFVSASTLSGGNWLVVGAGGVTGPQIGSTPSSEILAVRVDLTIAVTLSTAFYQGFVVVTGADGTSRATIAVNLSVNGGTNGVVTTSPSQLTFAYSTSAAPVVPSQTILVSTPVGFDFTATTDHPEWIVLPAQATGAVPGTLTVLVNPSAITTPNTYTGKVTITVGSVHQDVAVQLVVTASPVLWAETPNSGGTVLFTSQGSVSTPASQSVSLIASDGSSPGLSLFSSPSWASVSLNGKILTITPNVAGTAPAVLSDTVVITSTRVANSPLSIPVMLVENGGGSIGPLTINPSSLSFNALAGGAIPDAQTLTVSADSTIGFNVSTTTTNSVPWLHVSPSFGGSTNATLTVTVDPTLVAANANPYTGLISFAVASSIQPQIVPVTLTVSPANGGDITTDTNSLSLTAQVGTQKQTGTITVSNATGGLAPVLFNVATSASAPWLKASPAQAVTQSAVTITADPTGLAINTYQGQVTIMPAGGNPVMVNVSFTVEALPVISASRTSFTFTYLAGGDVPLAQAVQISGGAFTAAVTSGSDWLSVSPGSGNTTSNLTMSVNPSSLSSGLHAGVITVTGANNVVTINVTLNVTLPLPTVNSVVNGASLLPGAIAGGEVITAFGTDLGPVAAVTAQFDTAGNLATTLGGVQVLVNGFSAPLIYAGSTQVTAVVPYELARFLQAQATVQVTYLNRRSNVTTLGVANTSPAIFTVNSSGSGPGARNADFSSNGPNNPVSKGGNVVFFMTGEGPLDPAGVTGKVNPATGNPALAALPIAVLIDNQPANWTFAGGIRGVVEGIMQLNVQIPQNARSGDLPVLVTIGGNGSQGNVTVSVK